MVDVVNSAQRQGRILLRGMRTSSSPHGRGKYRWWVPIELVMVRRILIRLWICIRFDTYLGLSKASVLTVMLA